MSKADFVTSLILFALGIYMVVEGLGMPGAGGFIEVGGEPGKVPVLLGTILAIFALILMIRSASQRGYKLLQKADGEGPGLTGALRCAVTAIGCSFYAVGLLGAKFAGWTVMYQVATTLFIFLFIVGFEWQSAPELGQHRWARLQSRRPALARWVEAAFGFISSARAPFAWLIFMALLQALLVAWAVTYLFEQEFYVKLP